MRTKECSKCKIILCIDLFSKDKYAKDRLSYQCKKCHSVYAKTDKAKVYYNKQNKTVKAKACRKRYSETDRSKEIKFLYSKTEKSKTVARNTKKNKLKNDIQFKLKELLRSRLRSALKNNFKSGSAISDLGCSIPELKIHIEKQFIKGMTWKNWSYYGWHIDHIIPLDNFDLTNREELLKACHYTNLQPLWAIDNLKKGAKVLS